MGYVTKRVRTNAAGEKVTRWRARWTDITGAEKERLFDRKRDAQTWLAQVDTEVRLMGNVAPNADQQTFLQWWDDWTSSKLWAPATADTADTVRDSVPFGDITLRDLNRRHLQEWVKSMTDASPDLPDGLAPRTIRLRVGYVRRCLSAAVAQGILRINPAHALQLPRRPRATGEMMIPTTTQVHALLAAAPSRFRVVVALASLAGLRRGEALGITLDDIDTDQGTLLVRRQVQTIDGRVLIRQPKWGSARRVPLAGDLLDEIEKHRNTHGMVRTDQGIFLAGTNRGLMRDSTFYSNWSATRREAGLRDLKFHSLRHHFASRLIAQGIDVVTVQHALGHATPDTTLRFYAHLWPQAGDEQIRNTRKETHV